MRLVEELTRRRELHIPPRAVVVIGLLAALFVSALWLTGADSGAMKTLLLFILIPLIAFLAYVSDRQGGEMKKVLSGGPEQAIAFPEAGAGLPDSIPLN